MNRKMRSPQDWHTRFSHQAYWTDQVRDYLLGQARMQQGRSIIEIGCGTGAVLCRLPVFAGPYGLDINFKFLQHSRALVPYSPLTCGDAHQLPFQNNAFDISCCHFLLLWVTSPQKVLKEMVRISKPGGAVLVLAEPDYGGRIDYPEELQQLGAAQTESLLAQGADPFIGRKLPDLMNATGLKNIEIGIIGNQWHTTYNPEHHLSEWNTLLHDLTDHLPHDQLQAYQEIDRSAWEQGSRVLYVPTFYAYGEVEK
jgi:ubiquinone/menaquinone biosynthesis C-methylase UbiE